MKYPLTGKLTAVALALALGGISTQAAAVNFYFDQRAGFIMGGPGAMENTPITFSNDLSGVTGYPAGSYANIAWGTPFGQPLQSMMEMATFTSNLQAGPTPPGHATGGISPSAGLASHDTNMNSLWDEGEWWGITKLTQNPHEITPEGNPIWVLNTVANLTVYEDAAQTIVLEDQPLSTLPLTLFETGGSNTPDYYEVPKAAFEAPGFFSSGGINYRLDFRLNAFMGAVVDFMGDTIRVTTPEDGMSMAQVEMRFTQVPEPGSLALMSLGLVMAGGLAARRQRR